ncbi:hypothetical protein FRC11_000973, partial [Ceratobasidium sp. 423]
MDDDYYDRMYTSYIKGNKGRGGQKYHEIDGVRTKNIQHSFLEKLKTPAMKYMFIDKYGHPFAYKLGIPHFNPYGHVLRDPKVVARIDRPPGDDWSLYHAVGAYGDYDWYLDVLVSTVFICLIKADVSQALMRSLVNAYKPNAAALGLDDASITWQHYPAETREMIYEQGYIAIPVLFHFRDKTNKDCWLLQEMARNYLSGSKSYADKRKFDKEPTSLTRQNATKIAEKRAKKIPVPAPEDDPYYIKARAVGFGLKEANMSRSAVSKSRTGTASNATSKRDARRADKIVAEEESREKASKAGASKTEKSKAGTSKTQPEKSKANVSAPVKSSKAGTSEVKSGKVFKPVAPKENDKAKASNSVKKITRIESDEDSEEELLAKTRKLLAAPSVPLPTASPSKSPRMAFEGVVLKSPAPVKPKVRASLPLAQARTSQQGGKVMTSTTKVKSKLQHAPTPDHDSDDEVVEEPRRKRKAKDTPNEPPAKQQQLTKTPARAPEPIETDEEQEPVLPKRTARPKPLPPPAREPEIESQPDSTADKARSNKRPPRDLTPESEPEPEAKRPKSTSSKAQK